MTSTSAGAVQPSRVSRYSGGVLDAVLIALFFLSGFSALIYQVVWQRLLGLIVGVDVYAVSIIVATFMLGLGFGSYVGGVIADKVQRRYLVLIFAAAELAVAMVGFFSKSIFYDWLGSVATANSGMSILAASILALLLPTFCMGLSLPLLTKATVTSTNNVGRKIACLYGINTLGAAFGAISSTIILIRLSGITGAINFAAFLNVVTALGCFVLAVRTKPSVPGDSADSVEEKAANFSTYLFMFFLSGFAALALELLWFQLLGVLLKSTSFTFSWLLFLYLGGLASGSLVGAYTVDRSKHPFTVFLGVQSLIVLYSSVSLIVLLAMIEHRLLFKSVIRYLSSYEPMSFASLLHFQPLAVFLYCGVCGLLLIPATFMMGFSFPYFQKSVQTDVAGLGIRVGMLQLCNILGATFGTVVVGLVALNSVGAAGVLKTLTVIGAVFAYGWWRRRFHNSRHRWMSFGACFAALIGLFVLLPDTSKLWATLHVMDPTKIIASESATGLTVLKIENDVDKKVGVFVNGLGQSFLPFGSEPVHTQLGMLPVFIHDNPVDVGIVGLGSGDTLFSAGGRSETKSLTCIELIQSEHSALQALAKRRADPALQRVLTDSRIDYQFTDGRQFIGKGEKLYDVLEADALRPSSSYSNNVFSKEYFKLLKKHLKPGGLAVSWVPTDRVQQTFASVFPHNVQCGVLILGSDSPIKIDHEQLVQRLSADFTKRYYGLGNMDTAKMLNDITAHPEVVEANLDFVNKAGLNTDLFPRDEFSTPTR